jgi:hypothetical protein
VALAGLFGKPFVDVEPFLDTAPFAGIHEEVCLALAHLPTDYTGGSHRSMGIMPPSREAEALVDYNEVFRAMSGLERAILLSLADEPVDLDPEDPGDVELGEERDLPLSRRQMRYLELRYGVYFPWKVYYELVPNTRWTEKAQTGRNFTPEAMLHLPRTVAFVRSLPFVTRGSVKLLGLAAHDHGTTHRDADPAVKRDADHFVIFCPAGNKRLFVWDEEARAKTFAPSRAYWFNDADYHGIEADPFFRYSIRVDGEFDPRFVEQIAAHP